MKIRKYDFIFFQKEYGTVQASNYLTRKCFRHMQTMSSGSKSNQVQILQIWVVIVLMLTVPRAFFAGCAFRENVLKPFFVIVDDSNDKIEKVGRIITQTDIISSIATISNRSLWSEFGTNKSFYPKVFSSQRSTYLSGVQQSSNKYGNEYHEALVHPGMFAHDLPAQIAIIGGGEGATLREILKHDTVEKVKMIKSKEIMFERSKKYSPALSNCSDIMGSTDSCFDDERVEILFEDPFEWFVNNGKVLPSDESSNNDSNEGKTTKPKEKELFDVIVMDTFDPQEIVEGTEKLHEDDTFIRNLYESLTTDGILVIQMGSFPKHIFPHDEIGGNDKRSQFMHFIVGSGFKSVHMYNEVRQLYLINN